ncbi:MAG: sigma-70 family RNA polymerase sigma factor [Bryobacteraceae bacterium]
MGVPASIPFVSEHAAAGQERLEQEVVALFDQLRTPLFRFLLGQGLDAADAEEVIQEAFLALFEHLRSEKPRTNLRGWVFKVAHNQALKLLRRSGARATPLEDFAAAPDPTPEQRVQDNQRYRQLLAVMRALGPQDRAVLQLRAEGLRYREIAGVLDISLGSVAVSMERALARIEAARQ